jgi:2-dehydro-3-deoxygalactonokinase
MAQNAAICVDTGTTNTRSWIVADGRIVERMTEAIGLRDAARKRDGSVVREALRKLIGAANSRAGELRVEVEAVLAAGMLTSPLGLCEVPHLLAPVGEKDLAYALHKFSDAKISGLPIYLVPGVRSGPDSASLEDLADVDLVRGEETLVVGLLKAGVLAANRTLVNLGSHWKAIVIDEERRIARSFTTLSGELVHALQRQTVLASALPEGRLEEIDEEWLEKGRRFERDNGMGRAMFGVRLLEQIFRVGPTAASSFLLGGVVESDSQSMERAGALKGPIVITGAGAAAKAWETVLKAAGRRTTRCDGELTEQAFVGGLVRLFALHQEQRG